MSRCYDIQLEIDNVPMDGDEVLNILEEEAGCHLTETYPLNAENTHLMWDGDMRLCGGESEEEAHHRMVQLLQDKLCGLGNITFRFRCLEDCPWDAEFTTDAIPDSSEPIRFVFNVVRSMDTVHPEMVVSAWKLHQYPNGAGGVTVTYKVDEKWWATLRSLEAQSDKEKPFTIYTGNIERKGIIYEDTNWIELYI